jgi:hypothetical protein
MTHLVLIVRNAYEGCSFWTNSIPGGKWETEDEDFLQQHYEKRMKRLEYALIKWKLLSYLRLPISLQVTLWSILFRNL